MSTDRDEERAHRVEMERMAEKQAIALWRIADTLDDYIEMTLAVQLAAQAPLLAQLAGSEADPVALVSDLFAAVDGIRSKRAARDYLSREPWT